MKAIATLLVAVSVCGPSAAINKCSGADGRVTYQDAPCDGASKPSTIAVQSAPQDPDKQWRFVRSKDPMTSQEACFAISPEVIINASFGTRSYAKVFVQVAVLPNFGGMALTVRSRQGDARGIFHHDIAGLGVRVDDGPFVPLIEKISANALGFSDSVPQGLLAAMEHGQVIRLRLRFWPYDQLHDSGAIGLGGFKQATLSAMRCASK